MKRKQKIYSLSIFVLCSPLFINNISCNSAIETNVFEYKSINPVYNDIEIKPLTDTITFPLDELTYNSIKSFNLFRQGNKEFFSFYDDRSGSINIYDFKSKSPVKKLLLKKKLPGKKLYKTKSYVKTFDSIFVTNMSSLYLLDSSGLIKKHIDFLDEPRYALATFENTNPPILIGNYLYTSVRPYVDGESLNALRKWKVIYRFDLLNNKATLHFNLPEMYQRSYYGYHFLDYTHCFNDRGNFIFSFPADTNIYETNLDDTNWAYNGKSRTNSTPIKPLTLQALKNPDESYKQYAIQDSYGAIYFDPVRKRYLRIAKSKMNESNFDPKKNKRDYHFIIFDENLKIIGESPVTEGISYNSIFFTEDGRMYSRVRANDESAIHFVQLSYFEESNEKSGLTQKLNPHESKNN